MKPHQRLLTFLATLFGLFPVTAQSQPSLSLQDAVAEALAHHPSLHAAGAQAAAAREQTRQARAAYWPRIDFQESFARSNNPVFVFSSLLTQRRFTEANFAIRALNRPGFLNNFQSVLSVEQVVFDAGLTRKRVQSSQVGERLAGEQERASRMRIIAEVVQRYYGVLLAEESLKVAGEAVRSAQADLERAQAMRQAGLITDADVLSIRVHLAAMREEQIRREQELRVARSALNEAMGRPLDTAFQLTTSLEPLAVGAGELQHYEQAALDHRPETRQAALAEQLAQLQQQSARAAYWPQVALRAAFEADRREFYKTGGANWFVGATMRWNLWDGWAKSAQVRAATFTTEKAAAERRQVENGVRLEVRQAYAQLKAAAQRVEVTRATVDQAEESLRITKNRYEAGLTTVTELLRSETALLEAKLRALGALYDQRVAAVMLELASGTLNETSPVLQQ